MQDGSGAPLSVPEKVPLKDPIRVPFKVPFKDPRRVPLKAHLKDPGSRVPEPTRRPTFGVQGLGLKGYRV